MSNGNYIKLTIQICIHACCPRYVCAGSLTGDLFAVSASDETAADGNYRGDQRLLAQYTLQSYQHISYLWSHLTHIPRWSCRSLWVGLGILHPFHFTHTTLCGHHRTSAITLCPVCVTQWQHRIVHL